MLAVRELETLGKAYFSFGVHCMYFFFFAIDRVKRLFVFVQYSKLAIAKFIFVLSTLSL